MNRTETPSSTLAQPIAEIVSDSPPKRRQVSSNAAGATLLPRLPPLRFLATWRLFHKPQEALPRDEDLFILCDEMPRQFLTDFELMILLAIMRVGEDAYGVPVAREIEATGRRAVLLGAVYAALDRLQEMGLVSSSVGDPTPERGGRAKRFFRVTSKGLKAVKEAQRSLVAMWTNLPALKGGTA